MNLVNLTPHAITVVGADGQPLATLAPSGAVARVASSYVEVSTAGGISLQRQSFGEVEGLPAPAAETIYVVSALVRLASSDRKDLASPGELVRDADGRPVGCRGLVVG